MCEIIIHWLPLSFLVWSVYTTRYNWEKHVVTILENWLLRFLLYISFSLVAIISPSKCFLDLNMYLPCLNEEQDWVAQPSIKFKCQLKLNWHLNLLNLHLRFNWDLHLIDVRATQSWTSNNIYVSQLNYAWNGFFFVGSQTLLNYIVFGFPSLWSRERSYIKK